MESPGGFFRAITWICVVFLSIGPATAQNQSPRSGNPQSGAAEASNEQFKFRVSVNRVVLDVVVTDSNGKPVHGLTKQDFSLRENGAEQTILSFDVHSLDANPGYFAKLPPPPNTFVNIASEPERGPLYVLLLDLVNTEQDDQPYARQQLLKFVDSKPQGTRFAVFALSDGLHLVQGFSSDRAQLHATLDPAHSIPHVPRIFLLAANYGRNDSVMMASVFKQIALYVDGLQGRKNIIWMSRNFPLDLFPHVDDRPDTREESTEALDALARSESSIYPVDVSGVQVFPAGRMTGATTGAGPAVGAPGITVPDTQTIASQSRIAGSVGNSLSENNTVQDAIARMTGGRALYGRNDLKDALEEATEAGAEYYSLTYSPSNRNFDGKLRTIDVQVAQKGYRLEYRRGYLANGPQSPILPARYQAGATGTVRPIW